MSFTYNILLLFKTINTTPILQIRRLKLQKIKQLSQVHCSGHEGMLLRSPSRRTCCEGYRCLTASSPHTLIHCDIPAEITLRPHPLCFSQSMTMHGRGTKARFLSPYRLLQGQSLLRNAPSAWLHCSVSLPPHNPLPSLSPPVSHLHQIYSCSLSPLSFPDICCTSNSILASASQKTQADIPTVTEQEFEARSV